ncbi:hypothetical protein [Streptosporangium carneum]|uniref:Integral membrane protein n=1 Tax=Streptosporangium carneum TaxID=47481 RepID=A0A9W6I6U9_9ACTN|nr:hypothetical protein [Streptosporangium carneum]GLK13141.1 hypothetical protein GCM10017600_65520 [Streptosporangium carneum]
MSGRHEGAEPEHVEFAGAVYGSLLAASVIVGSTVEGGPPSSAELTTLLICTGVVFWITHVYAQVVSRGYPAKPLAWGNLRAVAKDEWPLAQASIPPAVAAAFASGLGGSDAVAAWTALGVAVASQVAWAVTAAVKTHSSRGVVVVSGVVNLVLGLIVVALKAVIAPH